MKSYGKFMVGLMLLSLFLFGGVSVLNVNRLMGSVETVGRRVSSLTTPIMSILFPDVKLLYGTKYYEFLDLYDIRLDFDSDEVYNKYKDYVFRVYETTDFDGEVHFRYYFLGKRNPLRFWEQKYAFNSYTTLTKPNLEWAKKRWLTQVDLIKKGDLEPYVR